MLPISLKETEHNYYLDRKGKIDMNANDVRKIALEAKNKLVDKSVKSKTNIKTLWTQ